MKKAICCAVVVILLFGSCTSTKSTASVSPPVNDTVNDLSFKKIMKDKELYAATTELVPLDSAYVTKDTLHFLTGKILGCEASNFKLLWNGSMMKSMPPQVPVKLFELVQPDCKEQHVFHLTYNISPLRSKPDSVSTVTDTVKKVILLRIAGWKPAIRYEY